MRLWRICRREHRALDGEGARLWGGRWTPPGHPVIYTAMSPSLATVERLVHTLPGYPGVDLVLVEIAAPDDLARTEVLAETLPDRWRESPAPEALQPIGMAWVIGGETALLSVPSAVVPLERNIVINPAHRDAGRLEIASTEPFTFDARLVRSVRRE